MLYVSIAEVRLISAGFLTPANVSAGDQTKPPVESGGGTSERDAFGGSA